MEYKSLVVITASVFLFGLMNSCKMEESANDVSLFIGTYTSNGSEGIYRYDFNLKTGKLHNQSLAAAMKNPSFIKIAPDKNTLYAVGEVDDYMGSSGSITTFRLKDTVLKKVAVQPSYGANPCYIGVSETGNYVAVANYTGGNTAVFSTMDDGNLEVNPQVIDHKLLDSTKTAHAHMAKFLNGELLVSDLGLDRIMKYSLREGEFTQSPQSQLIVAEGAGPRHFTTSQNHKFLYIINELNSTITVFQKDGDKYSAMATYDTLAKDFEGKSYCADIHLSPDGKFLYGSNRGENTIVIYKVDETNGTLQLIGRESVKGDWPRNFSIDPSGAYLLVANQKSNNIVVFDRDSQTGTLRFNNEVALPSPVCLVFN